MTLPNFIGLGAAKAGTTTLHDILIQHPDIFLPSLKESHFFDCPEYYDKGHGWYEKEIFGDYAHQKAIGEITPSYLYFDHVPERIYRLLGNRTKLICMFRNPMDRAYSHYLMMRRRGHEKESFEKAIGLEEERVKKGFYPGMRFSYIGSGLYATQIKRYLNYFPKENMFFIVFEEDFIKNRGVTITKLLDFLGVKGMELNLNIRSNPASYPKISFLNSLMFSPNPLKRAAKALVPSLALRRNIKSVIDGMNQTSHIFEKLDNDTKALLLKKYFSREIRELEEITGRDLRLWTAGNER